MKKLISILSFMSVILICHSQVDWGNITFDDTTWNNYIFIDTVSYPDNIWQVGKPDKNNFNQAYSIPNAIVTDTINSYPVNDTSVFYIRYITPDELPGGWTYTYLGFYYKIDTDDGADSGKIEFSIDNGVTWIDCLNDTLYPYCFLFFSEISFTGTQYEWQYFEVGIAAYNCFNFILGDTIWYKFTFISDGIQTGKEGWMIDNIILHDAWENVPEYIDQGQICLFPNPATSFITINVIGGQPIEEAIIYNHLGQKALEAVPVNNTVDVSTLRSGIYFIEVATNEWRGRAKLIKQ
jgi:hypothetical protein